MLDALHITRWTLISCFRCRFFWLWNVAAGLLIAALNELYFFDFDNDSWAVSDLFVSTVALGAVVNSIGFQILFTLRQRGSVWQTMSVGPTSATAFFGGLVLALVLLQALLALAFALIFTTALTLRDTSVPPGVWMSYSVLCLQLVSLSVAHVGISVLFSETWALILMVLIYIVGHLSELLYRSVPDSAVVLVDVLYCLVPDLESAGYLGSRETSVPVGLVARVALGTALYSVCILLGASTFLGRQAGSRNG